MKSYDEMANDVFRIGDERIAENKKKQKRTVGTLLAVAAVATVVLTVWRSGVFSPALSKEGGISAEQTTSADGFLQSESGLVAQTEVDGEPITDSAVFVPSTWNDALPTELYGGDTPEVTQDGGLNEKTGGDADGGTYGWWAIPCLPFDLDGLDFTGEAITDDEATKYFNDNREYFISSLSSSGVETGNIRFSEKGYSHVLYEGIEGKKGEVRRNFRDYIIYNGDEIIAIVTMVKEDGVLRDSIAYGAPWFDNYKSMLDKYKGQELVFAYAKMTELVLAPDGTCFNPMGYDMSEHIGGNGVKAYNAFHCPETVFVP